MRFDTATQGETGMLADLNGSAGSAASQKDGGKERYNNVGNTGASETIDLANGNVQRVVLDAATVTLSFTGASATDETAETIAGGLTLIVVQDATGGRLVTWPAAVDWAGGTAPTLSTGANAVDVFVFFTVDGGTTYYAGVFGQAFA